MFQLSSAAQPVHPEPPTLRSICPIGTPKVRQLEKRLHRSNSAARGQIAFKFRKMVFWHRRSCGIVKTHLGSNPIFNIPAPISFERLKLETSNFFVRIDYED